MGKKDQRFINEGFINPFRKKEVNFWAKKWKVSYNTVKDVMNFTGSSSVEKVENFLRRLNLLAGSANRFRSQGKQN